MSDIETQKRTLRKQISLALQALDTNTIHSQSDAACLKVCALPEFLNADTILCYMPLPFECGTENIVSAALAAGKRVAFPRCAPGHELELWIPRDESCFVSGSYGIMEPCPHRSDRIAANYIDLAIVPGVAFDRVMHRMGHGAGYYDRLLCDSSATLVGLALIPQLVDSVPHEQHDIMMDYVIVDKWIYCK
ncbi:MAG: 5-formyltetrahydrofolate cyclo-ligase [Clostridia bacterium]